MKFMMTMVVALAALCLVACGDSSSDSSGSAMCEAMADKYTACDEMESDRGTFLEACDAGMAAGQEPFGTMSETCMTLYTAILNCTTENADCGDVDENSPCAAEHQAFADECGR